MTPQTEKCFWTVSQHGTTKPVIEHWTAETDQLKPYPFTPAEAERMRKTFASAPAKP